MRTSVSHADEGTLHAYLDGELPAGDRTLVEAHLAECGTCRERLAEERGLIERADRLLTLAELPAGHTHRPAPPTAHPLRARPRLVVPGAWAASIAAAFLAGWLLRPTPEYRAAFARNDTTRLAQAPVAAYAPSEPMRDSVSTLARRAPARRRDAHPAGYDSSAAVALSHADARVDSPADSSPARQAVAPGVAAGKVTGPTLRGAAPTPIPPATVAVAPSSAEIPRMEARAQSASRPIGTTWTVIAPEPARKVLGVDVARIPGLPVRDILQNPTTPWEVMVEQEVADGTVIQLFQSRVDSAVLAFGNAQAMAVEAATPLQKTLGHLQVRISGPLAADSLLKLLELVR
ncbi:MAG TPA: zf-HC2 domain-containing protein [Gemmatimonadales bacterium]|nr:zf-HC2 domain-containing protein [Gemmatimonadales bacterium]